ncbi:scavenger receptor cysteine-rich domain-containing protein DMBT1-like isoform X2 [Leuresthes tenuis]|uniref:scavenger receptor cysteine-rich domain-containing protein DMBT1-like isoform X2 n=1 Tax=Leuresthes tenuis TaxID=355514 RepID=UPI003B5110EF
MKLLKSLLIIQLSICLCQAFQNSTSQTDRPEVSVTTEGNKIKPQEEFRNEPYVHRLAAKCSWTLRMPGNRSGDVVALPPDFADALVEQICQDLSCGSVYHVNKTSSSPNASCFHHCLYQDQRLQNCSDTVGSNCSAINQVVCGHQAARLAGGLDRCAGRVEVWTDGKWGTVCDDQWDLTDADVLCAQLGCGYALSVTGEGGIFPPGRGPVHLDELNCTGREQNLWACPSAQSESDCGHKEDAGVVCSEMRDVRLTGGLDRCSGKVEIHRNGSWGSVCDNCWEKNMASMVCSMLQCGAEPQKFTGFPHPFTHNEETPLYFYDCVKYTSLWQCKEYFNHPYFCFSSKLSGVICNGSLGLPNRTTADGNMITDMTTEETTLVTATAAAGLAFLSPELLSSIVLSLVLLVFLIINTVLCCLYRRRHAFLLQQTRTSSRPPSEHPQNNYKDAVNLVKVTANTLHPEDSQRNRTDVNLLKPSGLDCLSEEGPEVPNEETGAFVNYNGGVTDPRYTRVSKISMDSFETSSTSSGECYENINPNYINFTPDAGLDHNTFSFPLPDSLLPSGQEAALQSSDDDDYAPVSPD